MRIAFGTDESTPVTAHLLEWLGSAGHDVEIVVADAPWPEVGRAVGRAVVDDGAGLGVVCCWTGTGVSIAANKVPGVRAALCTDAESAAGARRWNDANVLALSLRLCSTALVEEILDAFLRTAPDADEAANIADVERHG